IDAGRSLLFASHHQGSAFAGSPRELGASGVGPRVAAIAAARPCDRCIDAGTASDLPAELLTAQARAVVVPDASMAADARTLMCDQLRAVGFSEVTMLSKPAEPADAVE